MVVKSFALGIVAAFIALIGTAKADEDMLVRKIEADACDERLAGDDLQTAENRAIDKASLAAVKTSGLIQGYYENLSDMALNLISYRIIDEYLFDLKHQVTLDDEKQVCVHVEADLEMAPEDLHVLVAEYKASAPIDKVEIAQIAEDVQQETQFKPQSLTEKKLLYIKNLRFWNEAETNIYRQLLQEQLAGSDYFYVTDDISIADYVLEPFVETSHVEGIDAHNRKMQIRLLLNVVAANNKDLPLISEQQNHFILFTADKDEQQVADTLIRKLLLRAAISVSAQINTQLANILEKQKRESR